jgi:hypothetical protein
MFVTKKLGSREILRMGKQGTRWGRSGRHVPRVHSSRFGIVMFRIESMGSEKTIVCKRIRPVTRQKGGRIFIGETDGFCHRKRNGVSQCHTSSF